MDRRGRDQFAIRYGDETEIYWNDHQKALAEEVSTPSAISAAESQMPVSPARSLHPVPVLMPVLSLQVYKRSFWTESFVQWSPQGGYLGTVHTRGVAVWGGPSFARLQRFTHTEVGTLLTFEGRPDQWLLGCSSVPPAVLCRVRKTACPACEATSKSLQCEKVWRQR